MPATSAAGSARRQIEKALNRAIPLEDDVLDYLLKVAPLSDDDDLQELVRDFLPQMTPSEHSALAQQLRSCSDGGDDDASSKRSKAQSSRAAAVSSSSKFRQHRSPEQETQDREAADQMLAQLLQEDEEADLAFSQQQQQARVSKKQKKGFRPLNINYTVGHNAGPVLGTAAPSSLADLLRSRRQQEMRSGPGTNPDAFGPPASRGGTNGPVSAWAPPQQGAELTWAERAQIAAERAAAGEATAAAAVAGVEASAMSRGYGMNIKIRRESGQDISINLDLNETVGDVKVKIDKMYSIQRVQQRLFHLGRELQDAQDMRSLGVREGAVLQLVLGRPPAAPPDVPTFPPRPGQARRDIPPPPPPVGPPRRLAAELTVKLRLPGGTAPAMMAGLYEATTILEMKQRIQQEHGIRADYVSLSFFGCSLLDYDSLADCGIASGAVLDIAIAPPMAGRNREMDSRVLQAPTPQGIGPGAAAGHKSKKTPQSTEAWAGLQTSDHGRVLTEEEALQMAMDASRSEAAARPVQTITGSPDPMPNGIDEMEPEEDIGVDAVLGSEEYQFLTDVNAQDASISQLIDHARRIASVHYSENFISKVSKRSGYRLTLVAEKVKKPKAIVGYMVYRFRRSTLNVIQLGVAGEDSGHAVERQLVKWLVQYSKKANMDQMVVSSRPHSVKWFQQWGFKRLDAEALEDEEPMEGHAILEYRCKKASKPQPKPHRPDFEPPAPFSSQPRTPPVNGNVTNVSRAELVKTVFRLCDADRDGRLNQQEMHTFAVKTGFDGGDDEWAPEFEMLCNDNGRSTSQGVDPVLLAKLVDDESDQGCYCSDAELREMIVKLEEIAATRKPPPPPPSEIVPVVSQRSRTDLVKAVFHACDIGGDDLLDVRELREFANLTGFDGSDDEWAEDYKMLCGDFASGSSYVSLDVFRQLVDDDSDNGCYCSDDELSSMLDRLLAARPSKVQEPEPENQQDQEPILRTPSFTDLATTETEPANPRTELILRVFYACDSDGDGRLNQQEMKKMAAQTGFEGTDAEWAEEFQLLCKDKGLNAAEGVSQEVFIDIMNDQSDDGIYCSDEELQSALVALLAEPPQEKALAPTEPPPPPPQQPQWPGMAPPPVKDQAAPNFVRNVAEVTSFKPAELPPPEPPRHQMDDTWEMLEVNRVESFSSEKPEPDKVSEPPLPPQPPPAATQDVKKLLKKGREDLIRFVFEACDADRDGHLGMHEMQNFAQYTGFSGSADDWREEFTLLCAERGATAIEGLDMSMFVQLVNDSTSSGCFCSDAELRNMVRQLFPTVMARMQAQEVPQKDPPPPQTQMNAGPSSSSSQSPALPIETTPAFSAAQAPMMNGGVTSQDQARGELVRNAFAALDVDLDDSLNQHEMQQFAKCSGFVGTDEEWAEEFSILLSENNSSVREGIRFEVFERLVNDETDNGCYCQDDELRKLVEQLDNQARPALLGEVFKLLDPNGRRKLTPQDLRRFASAAGIEVAGHLPPDSTLFAFTRLVDLEVGRRGAAGGGPLACPTRRLRQAVKTLKMEVDRGGQQGAATPSAPPPHTSPGDPSFRPPPGLEQFAAQANSSSMKPNSGGRGTAQPRGQPRGFSNAQGATWTPTLRQTQDPDAYRRHHTAKPSENPWVQTMVR